MLRRIYAIFIRQLFLLRANPIRIINIFLWLTVDMLLWGFLSKYLDSLGKATFSFGTVLLGAVILWGFLTRVQQGVMTTFLEDNWSHNFFNIFASPLKIKEYIGGMILSSVFTSVLGFMAMFLIVGLGFGFNIFRIGLYLIPFLFIIFIFGIALGVFSAAIVLRYGPSAEWLSWPIPFALSPFMGIFYPVSVLPHGLAVISKLVPPSYVFESMRRVLTIGHFSNDLVSMLAIGILLAFIYLFLACLYFYRIYKYVTRSGLITRFGSESF